MRAALLMLRKDLRVLRRSPGLLAALLVYPLVIAVLIGLAAGYANAKPRVALVDLDGLPPTVTIAGKTFDVNQTIDEVSRSVQLVRLPQAEAERQLRDGRVVAVITVPPGFVATLQGLVRSPHLTLETSTGGITPRVKQQMQALVYSLNRKLQDAYIAADLQFVDLLLHGGRGEVLGRSFDVLGLDRTAELLNRLPPGSTRDRIRAFVQDARVALGLTGEAIRATANPIELDQAPDVGRTWALSAQVQAYGLGLTISFLALLLAAGTIAAERDENTIGRLSRGLVGRGALVGAKVGVAAVVALALGLAIALVFGVVVQVGGVTGGEPWARLPLLAAGLALAGASLGAIGALVGALAREARTASVAALLVVLPIVFVGLVPRQIVPPAGWISDAFPFAHAVGLFEAALYDVHPWATVGRQALWLVGLGLGFGLLARLSARRLSA